jgi:hypothetical protein
MTWYEAEQVDAYLKELESALEHWTMDAVQMRYEQAELDRVTHKLGTKASKETNPQRIHYIRELVERISSCEECIEERLRR